MEDISIHFLQAKHRGGWPLLDISKALPWIKQLLLIFENGASAGRKGENVDMVLSLGRREWENTKTHHPLGVKRKVFFWCCLSKQEHWTTRSQEKRPGTKQALSLLFICKLNMEEYFRAIHHCVPFLKSIKDRGHDQLEHHSQKNLD